MSSRTINVECKILFKKHRKLLLEGTDKHGNDFYKQIERVKEEAYELFKQSEVVGLLNKKNLVRITIIQSSLRFMPHHRFYMKFAEIIDDVIK